MAPNVPSLDSLDGLSRRQVLAALGTVGVVGGGAVAGQSLLGDPEPIETTTPDEETSRQLAERHAPTLYFGAREKWFPTDPREFTSERDGEPILDGFRAFDEYTRRFKESGDPPAPAACYRVVEYPDTSLVAVQYWFYSAFDQFTTNFHWHDWEVLHVFVDTESEEPVLYVASAHSTSVPNNEFLDPETPRPSIISEIGSHSSALGVNEQRDTFQRVPLDGLIADITNGPLELADLAALPVAYGLPRDEGFRLPFAVPELDGKPVYEDDRLPNVTADDLLPTDVTVRSFSGLASPPTELPMRETGYTFAPAVADGTEGTGVDTEVDYEYDLVPIDEVRDITALTGPQLSFEFAVPTAAENAIASHLTAPDLPWEQDRFTDPSLDVSDPNHRTALRERYGIDHPSTGERLVGALRQAVPAPDAPDGEGVTTQESSVEGVCLLESDPVAVPTFNGVVAFQDVPEGDHRLTVNGAGLAPYAEELTVERGQGTALGVDGAVTTVANEDAVRVEADSESNLTNLTVTDDVGGRLYDGTPPGENGFAVYVHNAGAYTAEVTDDEGGTAAYRVNPNAGDDSVGLGTIRTGKVSYISFVVDLLTELRASVRTELGLETDTEVGSDADVDGDVDADADVNATADADNTTVDGSFETNSSVSTDNTTVSTDSETNETLVGDDTDSTEEERTRTATATETTTAAETVTETETTTVRGTSRRVSGTDALLDAIDAAIVTAKRALEAAETGDEAAANDALQVLQEQLTAIEETVDGGGQLSGQVRGLVRRRLQVARNRTQTALETPL